MKPYPWTRAIIALLLLSCFGAAFLWFGKTDKTIANVYHQGICIHSVDLSKVSESYSMLVDGVVANTIAVEAGRIRVQEATCPDRICVQQGWISDGLIPIVCLPNSLTIQIEAAPRQEGIDAIAR